MRLIEASIRDIVAYNLFKELANIEVQNASKLWLVENIKCFCVI
jgi:hypothetical protein